MLELAKLCFSAAAGIFSHLFIFKHGEWHMLVAYLFFLWVALVVLTLSYEAWQSHGNHCLDFLRGLVYVAIYHISLFGSMTAYRLFWHPLRKFPGPTAAAVSKLWHIYKNRSAQNHLFLDELHKEYGTLVRTGPNEITVFSHEGFEAMDGRGSPCQKSTWHDLLLPSLAINSTRDQAEHDTRRRVWNQSFSTTALKSYDLRVDEYAKLLDKRIGELSTKRASVNVSEWFHWFSFDVMGDLTFAKSFRMLENGEAHPIMEMLRDSLWLVGLLSPAPWVIKLGLDLFPSFSVVRQWNAWINYTKFLARERVKMSPDRPDISSWLIEASLNDSVPKEDQWRWIDGDSTAATIAGSDTVASTLVFVFHFLATLPEEQYKLRKELRDIDIFDHKTLQSLPHLNGIINETLRLRPPVPTHGGRETPPEGITVAGRYIPGGTTLFAPRWTIGRLPRYFVSPNEFIAERWYSRPELIKDKRAYQPFCLGRYSCAGKQLALSEVRLVTALLVSRYEISLGVNDDGKKVLGEMTDRFTVLPGPLRLSFKSSPLEG